MQNNPNTKPEFFEPVKVFLAILLAALFFFAPIAQPVEEEIPKELQSVLIGIQPFASNADACPFQCVRCITYDPDSWPRTCVDYYCDSDCENDPGDPGGGGPTYSPPTITHTLNCAQSGLNSWCIGALSIDLSASDPQGQALIISGDINGANFTCTTNPCTLNLPEGSGLVTYKVDSATGLSASGSAFFYLDVTTPQISGNVNGSLGNSGWYITQAVASASASDVLSGLASFEVSVNGASFTNYQSPIAFNDGIHSIRFRATDNAGNVTETAAQEIKVDTTAPTLNVAATGTTGNAGWYVSNVTLTPTATDAGSGLTALEMTTNGGPWTAVTTPIPLTDGIYSVQFRAIDRAGNASQTAVQQIKVDATTPSLSLNVSGTRGQNDWYTSATSVTPNASDTGSGINTIEAKINGGAWSIVNGPSSFVDGIHSYQYRVTDQAGNVTETPVLPMRVDTVPPAVAVYNEPLALGDTLIYDLEDSLSGLWISRSVIEDDAEKYKKIVWVEELAGNKSNNNQIRWDGIFADGTKAASGQYFITLKISDQAGNETMRTVTVEVTAFNALVPIPAFVPPANTVPAPVPGGSAPASESTFGGATNQPPADSQSTTVTEGGAQASFASMSLQAGGTTFSTGNQTANVPIANPNILWGATAAATLGATLAEWQRRREEEEAARRAAMFSGGGDEEEEASDVAAKKRAKVMAKNQAKRDQESRWEAARVAENQKNEEAIEAAWNQSRRAQSLESMSATIANQTAQREQERLNTGVRPHYSISRQDETLYRFPPHNFSRTPTPFKFDDPKYNLNNPNNINPKYWNLNGVKAVWQWNALYQNQITGQFPLPASFIKFEYPNTNCSNFTSAGWHFASLPIFNDPKNPLIYRTPENQQLTSSVNGEIRYRVNPNILQDTLKPHQVNQAIYDLYQSNPLAFVPGSIGYTKTGDIRGSDALAVDPNFIPYLYQNSFGHSVGFVSNEGAPMIMEMSGPARYGTDTEGRYIGKIIDIENGLYQWDYKDDIITTRSIFDFTIPSQTMVNGHPNGTYLETHVLTELSIVPPQPITPATLQNYGINFNLDTPVTVYDNVNGIASKTCYLNPETINNTVQQLYCPPTTTP